MPSPISATPMVTLWSIVQRSPVRIPRPMTIPTGRDDGQGRELRADIVAEEASNVPHGHEIEEPKYGTESVA